MCIPKGFPDRSASTHQVNQLFATAHQLRVALQGATNRSQPAHMTRVPRACADALTIGASSLS